MPNRDAVMLLNTNITWYISDVLGCGADVWRRHLSISNLNKCIIIGQALCEGL